MVCCWTWIVIAVIVAVLHGCGSRKCGSNNAIFGIYKQKNVHYYIKFAIIYAVIYLRKYVNKRKEEKNDSGTGYGVKLKENINEIDCVQKLPINSPEAADAVYFVGASKDLTYLVAAIARRPAGIVDSFWFLRIPEVGLLKSPKQPDTTLHADADNEYSADGLKIQSIRPMKEWKITYSGPMKLQDGEVNVEFDLTWKSELPYFDFDSDVPVATIASAIAREQWSRSYFNRLKTSHQTHHEQMGFLSGRAVIEGHGEFNIHMDSMRDHSVANKRDWKLMHRYGLHSVYVEDGTKFCVGIISHPDIFSVFEMGYLYTPDGRLFGVNSCNLELWRHGEEGTPPVDYSFNFKAGGRDYRVDCKVIESPEVFIGPQWEARVVERMCTYRVNGKRAWGFAEWEYRHHGGRPIDNST
ncbi:hypothetical protein CHUAL_008243 [Chamberlinius hualienensis]